jgi:hypothetical protein
MNVLQLPATRHRAVLAILVAGCALALGGCDRQAPKTTMGEKVDSAERVDIPVPA